jgi:hypothetical protein
MREVAFENNSGYCILRFPSKKKGDGHTWAVMPFYRNSEKWKNKLWLNFEAHSWCITK